jgi:uncharacterized protein YbjT (DUF2867 family)
LEAGYRVRRLVRDAHRLQGRPWSEQVEEAAGDATRPETLPSAVAGVWAVYYCIHSLSDTANHRELMRVSGRALLEKSMAERPSYRAPLSRAVRSSRISASV